MATLRVLLTLALAARTFGLTCWSGGSTQYTAGCSFDDNDWDDDWLSDVSEDTLDTSTVCSGSYDACYTVQAEPVWGWSEKCYKYSFHGGCAYLTNECSDWNREDDGMEETIACTVCTTGSCNPQTWDGEHFYLRRAELGADGGALGGGECRTNEGLLFCVIGSVWAGVGTVDDALSTLGPRLSTEHRAAP